MMSLVLVRINPTYNHQKHPLNPTKPNFTQQIDLHLGPRLFRAKRTRCRWRVTEHRADQGFLHFLGDDGRSGDMAVTIPLDLLVGWWFGTWKLMVVNSG